MTSARRAFLTVLGGFLAAAGLAVPSDGFAKPKVLVLPYQNLDPKMQDDIGEQTTVVVTREMAHGDEVAIIRAEDLSGLSSGGGSASGPKSSDAPQGDPKAGKRAEQLISEAKEAMEESEFERAVKLLDKAAKLLEDNGDAVPDLRMLPETYLQMGVAYFRDGMEDEGDDMLNRAVHYDPERTLNAADYPPIFIRVFDRARFNVLRRPRARVEVRAASGSQVLFDGRNMGKAPLVLTDALPGTHWIRVERPGETPKVKKLRISSKKTTVVDFDEGGEAAEPAAGGVLGAVAANELNAEHVEQLVKAGKRAGADMVMVGGIYSTDTAFRIRTIAVKVASGDVGRLVDIAFDLDMLTAEIEVYKLAEAARNEAKASAFTNPITESKFKIAPKKPGRARRRTVAAGAKETRMPSVRAAPPPLKAPKSLYADVPPDPPPGPIAKATPAPVSKAGVVPKDEMKSSKAKSAPAAATTTTLVPKDELDDDDDGGAWWVWVLVGVAAAGAAGAGGYLLVSGGGSDEASLRITW